MTTPELLFANLNNLTHAERAEIRTRVAEWEELRVALSALVERYADLVNSGDCGCWNPEDEPQVANARALLARTERGE